MTVIVLAGIWFCVPIGFGVWLIIKEGIKVSIWKYIVAGLWLVFCIRNAIELEEKVREGSV